MGRFKRVNNFVCEDHSIQYLSTFNIARLFKGNEEREEGLEVVSNCFGDNFVDDIDEGDGSKVTEEGGTRFFGNQSELGGIEIE